MARTAEAQKNRRYKRALRWELVHSAGCTNEHCVTKELVVVVDNVAEAREIGVRIPRSYRKLSAGFASSESQTDAQQELV